MPDSLIQDRWTHEAIAGKLWEVIDGMNQDPVDTWTRERLKWLANELQPPHGQPYRPTPLPPKNRPINTENRHHG